MLGILSIFIKNKILFNLPESYGKNIFAGKWMKKIKKTV